MHLEWAVHLTTGETAIFLLFGAFNFILAWFLTSYSLKQKKKKIKIIKEGHLQELRKLGSLLSARFKISTDEHVKFIEWVNEDLPKEIASIFYLDSKLHTLKDRANISDKQFLEAFEHVIMNIQSLVGHKSQNIIDVLNKQTVDKLKELIEDESDYDVSKEPKS